MPDLPRLDVPYGEFMPEEYSNDLFQNLESQRQRQEEVQMKDYMEGINSLGKLHTGTALKGAMQTVLGPSMERRNALIGGIAREGVGFNRDERLGDQQYGRQQETTLQFQGFQERMQQMMNEQRMREMAQQQEYYRKNNKKKSWNDYLTEGFGQGLGSLAQSFPQGIASGISGGLSRFGGSPASPASQQSSPYTGMGSQSYQSPNYLPMLY